MPSIEIRPFKRSDRDQLATLVNAHVGTVLPGVSLSVNAVMSQLEREPDEFVVDPWVIERATLVVVEADRLVAAAHLVRYGDGEQVGADQRGAGELRWLLCWPADVAAGEALLAACLQRLTAWDVTRVLADSSLPAPAVYGVPDCWPHVRRLYERAGFTPGAEEVVLVADVADLPQPGPPPIEGLAVRRVVGDAATSFVATLGETPVGLIELQTDLTEGGTRSRLAGWAELWNLAVEEPYRRRGAGRWLVGHAADWMRLGRVERVLDYCGPDEHDALAFGTACGWRELTRTTRGWTRG
ncbi:GNAT family N-acetyltransferase [Conexibacter woesei]|uniref:GCN5-related N-acetyltransferase n=1 Tax=Conexibacter woesei (strain DSM 14684 / CCUG 47730 / CIP 108061 / JCM 11494 / NBRC 100937 / ID131577) TaxID=469383 RepID=D3FET4_CONWI|nr:GNAT family N-acetyltransferase [Conexibacter woesei]ADB49758.1 GCN5-related N-acetyltransferase [Conexibacter woesei DSM 14684]